MASTKLFEEAFKNQDPVAVASFYAEDCTVLSPLGDIRGREGWFVSCGYMANELCTGCMGGVEAFSSKCRVDHAIAGRYFARPTYLERGPCC